MGVGIASSTEGLELLQLLSSCLHSILAIFHLPSSMAIKLPQTSNLCVGGIEIRCAFFSLGNALKKRIDSVTLTSHGCKDEQRIFAWVLLLPVLRGFEALCSCRHHVCNPPYKRIFQSST
jgi:hypothetical protein